MPERLTKAQIDAFYTTLTAKQRRLWEPIWEAMKQEVQEARVEAKATGEKKSTRDALYEAFQSVKGTITAEKLTELIENAVKKGDAQTLRVLAQLAGEDLTERVQQQAGPGAEVIIFRPYQDKEIHGECPPMLTS